MRYPTHFVVPAALMLALFACEQTETTTGPERVIAGPSFEANPESEGQVFVTYPYADFRIGSPKSGCSIYNDVENPNPVWIRYKVGSDPDLDAMWMEHVVVREGTLVFSEYPNSFYGEGHGVASTKYNANGDFVSLTFTIKGKIPGYAVTCQYIVNKNDEGDYLRYMEPLDD